jgi:glyoxylase-like metal-dependent hydrolase (beta-lactamase superfamily II)/ferredoxin
MADVTKKVAENVDGEFFVDTTCIDCGTCRQVTPSTFAEANEYSYVYHQPENQQEIRQALQALVCCPTGSIGTRSPNQSKSVLQDFPLQIEENLFYNGFTSPQSYGASSYFIQHPDGNWMIDSPKFLPTLVRQFEAMGGIRYLFLTHSDDVADAARYADKFGAVRIIHRQESWAQPEAEIILDGLESHTIHPEFTVIPTPGHTKGSSCLLYKNWALFTGDHLWWNPAQRRLEMPTHYYWNKAEQIKSSQKLIQHQFEWVLPGHGHSVKLPYSSIKAAFENMLTMFIENEYSAFLEFS